MMFRSLRNRLILSHILPALLIIPLMGAAMVYVLETRLLLPVVYKDLAADASLMAEPVRRGGRHDDGLRIDHLAHHAAGRIRRRHEDG